MGQRRRDPKRKEGGRGDLRIDLKGSRGGNSRRKPFTLPSRTVRAKWWEKKSRKKHSKKTRESIKLPSNGFSAELFSEGRRKGREEDASRTGNRNSAKDNPGKGRQTGNTRATARGERRGKGNQRIRRAASIQGKRGDETHPLGSTRHFYSTAGGGKWGVICKGRDPDALKEKTGGDYEGL